jgi:hypothetical protein
MKKIILTGLFTLMMLISFGFSNVEKKDKHSEETGISIVDSFDTCETRKCILIGGETYCTEWKEVPCPDDDWNPEQ